MKKTIRLALCGLIFILIQMFLLSRVGAATSEETWQALQLASFDRVWTTIRDQHWDSSLGELDWEALRDELRPGVELAETERDARLVLQSLIDRLGQSHFAVIPHEVYERLAGAPGEGLRDGATGLDLRVVGGDVLVTSVRPGTPAAAEGVRPGWILLRVDGESLQPEMEQVASELGESLYLEGVLAGVALGRVAGPVGREVELTFADADENPVSMNLVLEPERGRRFQMGYLPPLQVWIATERLGGDVGYITFNMFVDPAQVMPVFNEAMQSFLDAEGLVIDLRGNPGGMPQMAVGMSGWLISEPGHKLGVMRTRETEINLVVPPRLRTFDGPVALLVDGLSGSCSELLSGGLQGLGRARVFGTRTMGAVLPSRIEKLPSGDGFQFAFADFVAAGGRRLEGAGVEPDVLAPHTREALLAGRDNALEEARRWIAEQRSTERAESAERTNLRRRSRR